MSKEIKSPAYQWYYKDYMTDTRVMELTLAEEGAYRKLIDLCFSLGGEITADNKRLMTLVGKECTIEMVKNIKKFFIVSENKTMRHKRIDFEIEKQKSFRESRKANGSKGGRPTKENLVDISSYPTDKLDETETKALHLHSALAFANNNSLSPMRDEIFEKIKGSETPFSDVVMLVCPEVYQKCERLAGAGQWPPLLNGFNLKVTEDRWNWSGDFDVDVASLRAWLENYTNTWVKYEKDKVLKPFAKKVATPPDNDYELQELQRKERKRIDLTVKTT
jgi:uncharacterized protein YdaU (DUF1376 family)